MRYRFLRFEIDEDSFCILRAGKRVAAEPRVLEFLLHLIANRDRMVTKVELLEKVWRGVAVTPSAVDRCASLARRLVGKRAAIRTVHARGYQWVEPTA